MKKTILFLLPTLLLSFISAYILLIGIYGRGWNRTAILSVFLATVLLNYIYYVWLVVSKKINTKLTITYIPIAFSLFVIFIICITHPPYKRDVRFNLGEDPFAPGTTITGLSSFYFWQKGFYFPKTAITEKEATIIADMQITRQGSLIGHVGNDLQGWSAEKIKSAFGEPAQIIQINETMEKWLYHPWTNHPDWAMPVYVQNKSLLKIGD